MTCFLLFPSFHFILKVLCFPQRVSVRTRCRDEWHLSVYKVLSKGKPLLSLVGSDWSSTAVIKGKQLPWKSPCVPCTLRRSRNLNGNDCFFSPCCFDLNNPSSRWTLGYCPKIWCHQGADFFLGTHWLLSVSPASGPTCLSIEKTISFHHESTESKDQDQTEEKICLKGSDSHFCFLEPCGRGAVHFFIAGHKWHHCWSIWCILMPPFTFP